MAIAIGVLLAVLVLAVAVLITRRPRRPGPQVSLRPERPAAPAPPRMPAPSAPPRTRATPPPAPGRGTPPAPSPGRPRPSNAASPVAPPARSAPTVPAAPASAAMARPVAPPVAPARRPQVRASGGPTVLIVDDSAIMRRTLDVLFSQAGYRTACVEDGNRAVTWVGQYGLPALVTLDMEMPGLNGLETLRSLHDAAGGEIIPAVFVTTRSHEQVRETATQLGALAFFSKPFDSEDLLALARRVAPLPAGALHA